MHEVGVTRCMWPVHVGSLRAGEGRAHRKGDASGGGGGGERGRAGSRGRWRGRASRGTVEAPTRPQTRHGVILGDEAPTYSKNGPMRPSEFEESATSIYFRNIRK